MKEKVQKIKEFVWQKYVDFAHPTSEFTEEEGLGLLEQHYAKADPEEDPECYYLGILLFELGYQLPERQKLYFAKAKMVFEQYRTRTGETDWEVVEDRLEEIDEFLQGLGPDERAQLFATVQDELLTTGAAAAVQESAPPVEGMVLVPAGAFLSGSNGEQSELDSFYIDTFPVTNSDYRKFIEATGYRRPKFWSEDRLREPKAPVVGISWYDADKYATWAGKTLPTAIQWEKAARGFEGRVFPWGNEFDETMANFGHVDGEDMVCDVDRFGENRSVFGARDLAGNVWEWTRDWDHIEIDMKVIFGGSWADPPQFLRCDRHLYANPKDKFDNIGFRCAKPAG